VHDVLADEPPGIMKPDGYTSFRQRNLRVRSPTGLADVDPLLALVDVDVAQPVRLDDVELLVLALAEMRVDDDGAVVARVQQGRDRTRPASSP
jgi:hypothetical protein